VLAIGILVVASIAAYAFLINPIITAYFEKSDEISDLKFRIEKYQRMAASSTDVERYLSRVKRMIPSQGYYLKGDSAALASANLQQYLSRIIESSGGKIVSTQNVRDEMAGVSTAVTIRVHMRGDVNTLINTISRLEAGKPMLFMENLAVVASPQRKLLGTNAVEAKQLDIQFNLVGYLLTEEA
jgi:general secretion pathway protein M